MPQKTAKSFISPTDKMLKFSSKFYDDPLVLKLLNILIVVIKIMISKQKAIKTAITCGKKV